MTKSNGIKSLKQAAKLLNRHAPDGESLAYINPDEGRLLKAHGGSGIMTVAGVPSYKWSWNPLEWDWSAENVAKRVGQVGDFLGYGDKTITDPDDPNKKITKQGRSIVGDTLSILAYLRAKKDKEGLNEHEMNMYNDLLAQTAGHEAEFDLSTAGGAELTAPLYSSNLSDVAAPKTIDFSGNTTPALTLSAEGGRIGYDNGGIGQLMPRLGYQEGTHPLDGVAMQMFGMPFNSLNPLQQITVSQSQDQTSIKPNIQIPSDSTINTGDPYSSNIWTAAQGGRIGYGIGSLPINSQPQGEESIKMAGTDTPPIEMENLQELLSAFYEAFGRYPTSIDELKGWARNKTQAPQEEVIRGMAAYGGRIGYAGGNQVLPLLDLGGQEKDYREDGGFVPIGRKEKADDVPARLSKNEFVFTADAVRAAGGGDIDEGAQRMYNVMKNLEAGGEISQETQGKA